MDNETQVEETIVIYPDTTCRACVEPVSVSDAYCHHCGYPLQGTVEQQDAFIHSRDFKVLELSEMQARISSSSTTLFVLAAIFALSGLVYFAFHSHDGNPVALLIVNGILALIFLALGMWCKKQPVASLISGLVFYAIIQVMNFIESPASIFSGILFKVIIIAYLVKGLNSAFAAQKIKRELNL